MVRRQSRTAAGGEAGESSSTPSTTKQVKVETASPRSARSTRKRPTSSATADELASIPLLTASLDAAHSSRGKRKPKADEDVHSKTPIVPMPGLKRSGRVKPAPTATRIVTIVPSKKGRRPDLSPESSKFKAVPPNDALDSSCLAEFRACTTVQEVVKLRENEIELSRVLLRAMRATKGELCCPGCQKSFGSATGFIYHISRCPGPDSNVLGLERTLTQLSWDELEEQPWLWSLAKDQAQKSLYNDQVKKCGSFPCPRRGDDCPENLESWEEASAHLNECTFPNYYIFKDRVPLFRNLSKTNKTLLIRRAMSVGQARCLICEKSFSHNYGLLYHVERCGLTDEERRNLTWRCYRCGFTCPNEERESHLNLCQQTENGKSVSNPGSEDGDAVNGIFNKRRKWSAFGEITTSIEMPCAADLQRIKFRAADIPASLNTSDREYKNYQDALANSLQQFRENYRKNAVCCLLSEKMKKLQKLSALDDSSEYLANLSEKKSIGFRERPSDKKEADSFRKLAGLAESGMKSAKKASIRTDFLKMPDDLTRLHCFDSTTFELRKELATCTAFTGGPISAISVASNSMSDGSECVAVSVFPDEESLTGTSAEDEWRRNDSYVQLWRLRKHNERCELSPWCLLLVRGRGLVLSLDWQRPPVEEFDSKDQGIGFLVIGCANGTLLIYGIREDLLPPVAKREKKGEGRAEMPPIVCPEPLLELIRPTDDEIAVHFRMGGGMSEDEEEHPEEDTTQGGADGEGSERANEEGEEAENGMESSQETTSQPSTTTTAGETSTLTSPPAKKRRSRLPQDPSAIRKRKQELRLSHKQLAKEQRNEKKRLFLLAKEEEVRERETVTALPPPPIVRVVWSPFSASEIAACDAAGLVFVWRLDEAKMVEKKGERGAEGTTTNGLKSSAGSKSSRLVLPPCRILNQEEWAAPAVSVAWVEEDQVVIGFDDKSLRIVNTKNCQVHLEETTAKLVGRCVASCASVFGGFFTFQSDSVQIGTTQLDATVGFVALDLSHRCYSVIPLANKHQLQSWDVAVDARRGAVASCGCDGRVLLGVNGSALPRTAAETTSLNSTEYLKKFHVALVREPLLIIKNRVTPEEDFSSPKKGGKGADGKEGEEPPLPPVYFTHQSACENMWLDVVVDGAQKITLPDLPSASLDLRVESLNAIAVGKSGLYVTGGQAGLLFAGSTSIAPGLSPKEKDEKE